MDWVLLSVGFGSCLVNGALFLLVRRAEDEAIRCANDAMAAAGRAQEAMDDLMAILRPPPIQWRSPCVERMH